MATIDVGAGIHLSFLDSGPPPSARTYTTLLLVHGYGWNANTWERVVAAAPARGVRAVAIHRRQYGDSTKLTDEELASATAQDALETGAVDKFMRKRAVELATFIKKFVQSADLSPPGDGEGGIVLLSWSLGNMYSIDFLGRYLTLPSDIQDVIRIHVCGCIFYDAFSDLLDILNPHPSGSPYVYTIIQRAVSAGNSPEDAVGNWISGWHAYPHPEVVDLEQRYGRYNQDPPLRTSTWQRQVDTPAFQRTLALDRGTPDMNIMASVWAADWYKASVAKLLYEDPEKAFWPGFKVEWISGANSIWVCIYAVDVVRERFESTVPGRKMRLMDHANHFIHWEDADYFLDAVTSII